jgi:hypothetical protein
MDPTTIVLAIIVAFQTLYQVRLKFVTDQKTAENERLANLANAQAVEAKSSLDVAVRVDERIREILDRQSAEIASLKQRVEALEVIESDFQLARGYMAYHGLRWPPPEGWPPDSDWPTT